MQPSSKSSSNSNTRRPSPAPSCRSRSLKLGLLALWLAGCAGPQAPPPQAVSIAQVQTARPELDGKVVVVEGYPGLASPATRESTGTQSFMLLDQPVVSNEHTKVFVRVVLPAGTSPDRAERLPNEYEEQDFKVYGHDGKLLGFKDKVRVTGVYHATGPQGIHISEAPTVEKL